MRRDFDIAALCDDRVDGLRISGLDTDKAAEQVSGGRPEFDQ